MKRSASPSRPSPERGTFGSDLRGVLAGTRRDLHGHDLVLATSGATFFGALAAIPTLLTAIAVSRLLFGPGVISRYGARLAATVPSGSGADRWIGSLFGAAATLSPVGVVFAVFMASTYGRGLSRALRRFAPADQRDLPPTWWSRALTLPLLGLAPLLLLGLLLVVPAVADLQHHHGLAGVAGASYLGLNVVWVITWLPLTWTFRVVAPGCPSWRAALIGGVVTGAFVSGFLQGFTLFLALPINLGRPFGGLTAVGVTTAMLLWLWVLHAVVCVGYTFTWNLDAVLAARAAVTAGGERRLARRPVSEPGGG